MAAQLISTDIKDIEHRYILFLAGSSFLPWLPVFFLYLNERLPADQVVLLSAVYYMAVVFFEVPSGYLSDRIGRRPVLLIGTLASVLAYLLFLFGHGFGVLALAQCLLAASIAFRSGSDTALLFDFLKSKQAEHHYARIEAKGHMYALIALALSCLLGGLISIWSLEAVYLVSATVAAATLVLASRLPDTGQGRSREPFHQQLQRTVSYLRIPVVRWFMFLFMLAYSLEHLPYEFYQPWLLLLGEQEAIPGVSDAPISLVSGVVIAMSMFGGAIGAAYSNTLDRHLGFYRLVTVALGIQIAIVAAMGLWLHASIIALIVFRNFSMALLHSPLLSRLNSQIASEHRATVLSTQSLAGRLAFSMVLLLITQLVGETERFNHSQLSGILLGCAVVSALLTLVVATLARKPFQIANRIPAQQRDADVS